MHRTLSILALILALCASLHAAGFSQPDAKAQPQLFLWSDTCNVWVLREGDAALLIDLGDGSVLDHLQEIGVKRVEWVLLTGHHRELSQGIDLLDRQQTQIASPKEEQELFETPNTFRKWNPRLADKFSVNGASYVRPPRVARKIEDRKSVV